MEFTFKWPKNKFLGCFALILLFGVKGLHSVRIPSESENDLEEEFSFTLCGHATLFNAEKIFSVNKVSFKDTDKCLFLKTSCVVLDYHFE